MVARLDLLDDKMVQLLALLGPCSRDFGQPRDIGALTSCMVERLSEQLLDGLIVILTQKMRFFVVPGDQAGSLQRPQQYTIHSSSGSVADDVGEYDAALGDKDSFVILGCDGLEFVDATIRSVAVDYLPALGCEQLLLGGQWQSLHQGFDNGGCSSTGHVSSDARVEGDNPCGFAECSGTVDCENPVGDYILGISATDAGNDATSVMLQPIDEVTETSDGDESNDAVGVASAMNDGIRAVFEFSF